MIITSRYSDRPEVVIDESKIPIELRPLLPFAREWSIEDDCELEEYILAASYEKRRQLFEAFRPHFGALDKWHNEFCHHVPISDEIVVFSIATHAAAFVGTTL